MTVNGLHPLIAVLSRDDRKQSEYRLNMRRAYLAVVLSLVLIAGCSTSTNAVSAGPSWSKPIQVEGTGLSPDYRSLYGVSLSVSMT